MASQLFMLSHNMIVLLNSRTLAWFRNENSCVLTLYAFFFSRWANELGGFHHFQGDFDLI